MASPAYPDSDDGVGSEFEGSDDGTQTDITVSDSDQEYLHDGAPASECTTHGYTPTQQKKDVKALQGK